MDKKVSKTEISHLLCREIHPSLFSALIKKFSREIGENKTLAIANEVIREDAILSGKALAEKYSGNSLSVLLKLVKKV